MLITMTQSPASYIIHIIMQLQHYSP